MAAAEPADPRHPYDHRTLPPVVTIYAQSGTGVETIAPQVAAQLGVPWHDNVIPPELAARAGLPPDLVADVLHRRRWRRRRRSEPSETTGATAGRTPPGAVVVGPAGTVLLRSIPGALHVQLDGPWERRIARIMATERVDRPSAEQLAGTADRARAAWIRRTFGTTADDPDLYHLRLDSTAYSMDTCVDLIVSASNRRTGVTDLAPSWV